MRRHFFGAAMLLLLTCASAFAQQTTGTITGRVVDQQGAAVPGRDGDREERDDRLHAIGSQRR